MDSRPRLLLALQVALLGMVTPNMRAVFCQITSKCIEIVTVFDGDVRAADRLNMEEVSSEVISHFPEMEEIVSQCIRLDAPSPLDLSKYGDAVFRRYEAI